VKDFEFQNTTKIIFGRGSDNKVGKEVKTLGGSKVLLHHYGDNIIKEIGLYDRIINSLKSEGIDIVELAGVKPNPRLSLVREGIGLCRKENVDLILAVGGGSVIDSAKAISLGLSYKGDVWDFFSGKAKEEVASILPVGVVLTLPASGSESHPGAVITNEDGWHKRGYPSDVLLPKFAILNPENTFSLPPYQTSCGISDILSHMMERYFTREPDVDLTDKLIESLYKTVIKNAYIVMGEPSDYNARAEIMLAGTLAHNGIMGMGRTEDWASHGIEHVLSAVYDIAHGAGIAVIFPAWMKYVYKKNIDRFYQFAVKIWDVAPEPGAREDIALEGIDRYIGFLRMMGLPTTLKEAEIPYDRLDEIAEKCTGGKEIGSFARLNRQDVLNILDLSR